ncbi:BlaI/MecI/CopY family transcriptional regulator [Streptomyces ipomoeae]|uniref:BlaI/MecI/CopY family transcriptional regulator n=1 Tax=Streptomyces ipomoeae TaxID=103232 RepID=UPI00114730D2|nr:BlaI/MecI/CopY family transcriptional regulator [Streptomyces ipomoeae]MDX2936117.1 BlaI/MecI/CopY family transcriptional regulator [Streptomyces ipomoeae]TQE31192.1 hypothetical protein SipoB123_02510 [Streptomyces ipomoeae]
MSEDTLDTTDLKAQYTAQVAADLERNSKEQERIGAEIAGLQEQLEALRRDQAVLMSMQAALGGPGAATAGETATASAKTAADSPAAAVPPQKTALPQPRSRKKSPAKKKTAADSAAAQTAKTPTLGELILEQLRQHTEPRSAAEVTATLAQSHPERQAKAKVVRMTVESLVAKGLVERAKQGRSVFYTAAAAPTADSTPSTEPTTENSAE